MHTLLWKVKITWFLYGSNSETSWKHSKATSESVQLERGWGLQGSLTTFLLFFFVRLIWQKEITKVPCNSIFKYLFKIKHKIAEEKRPQSLGLPQERTPYKQNSIFREGNNLCVNTFDHRLRVHPSKVNDFSKTVLRFSENMKNGVTVHSVKTTI